MKANGDLTYHGKSYAPEETPRGAAHVTVKPNGEFQVNEGTLSDAGRKALEKAVGKPSQNYQRSLIYGEREAPATEGRSKLQNEDTSFNPETFGSETDEPVMKKPGKKKSPLKNML